MFLLSFRSNCKLIIERTNVSYKSCKIIGQNGTIILSDYTCPNEYTIIVNGNVIQRKFETYNKLTDAINALDMCRSKGILEHPDMTLADTRKIIEIVNSIQRELQYE